jgi:hypothetical protein
MIPRLNEVNRVLHALQVLGSGDTSVWIPVDALMRQCTSTVQEGLLPNHEETIAFVVTVGWAQIEDASIRLTEDGKDLAGLNPDGFFELTRDQAQVIARRYYLGGEFRRECRGLLSAFSWSESRQRLCWSELEDRQHDGPEWVVEHLCQLDVLQRTPGGLETTRSMTAATRAFVDEPKGLTESRLRQLLREKEAVGDIGEVLVVAFERKRLSEAGASVQAHCVRRIGNIRLNAGFDVESFDGLGESLHFDRFIEVKAGRGKELRFFWSDNEMKVAESLGGQYWIYFLGGIDIDSRSSSVQPLLFQDPIRSLLQDARVSTAPQGLIVQGPYRGARL